MLTLKRVGLTFWTCFGRCPNLAHWHWHLKPRKARLVARICVCYLRLHNGQGSKCCLHRLGRSAVVNQAPRIVHFKKLLALGLHSLPLINSIDGACAEQKQPLCDLASSIPGSGKMKRCLSFVRLKYDLPAGNTVELVSFTRPARLAVAR